MKMKIDAILLVWMLAAGLLVVGTGCCDHLQWHDLPGAVVTPVAPGDKLGPWTSEVDAAIDSWNTGLVALGCPAPFTTGVGGHMLEWVSPDVWKYPGRGGYEDHDNESILVLGSTTTNELAADGWGVIAHELGHALGLNHADSKFGPSIMTAHNGGKIYPRDYAAAACALGCGPCDSTGDHYDH